MYYVEFGGNYSVMLFHACNTNIHKLYKAFNLDHTTV